MKWLREWWREFRKSPSDRIDEYLAEREEAMRAQFIAAGKTQEEWLAFWQEHGRADETRALARALIIRGHR